MGSPVPEPRPLSPDEIKRMLIEHAALPQCRKCMQPQRCTIGRLLDTIGSIAAVKGRAR